MADKGIQSMLEALLFVSGEPVEIARLTGVLDVEREAVEEALESLRAGYARGEGRGLALVFHEGAVELVTKSEYGALIEDWQQSAAKESLSKVALEVLAVVAYRAPVTRAEIEAIRGVNCQFTLRNLLLRGLIERQDEGGVRGYSYTVTIDFLKHLGLERVGDLPEYAALSEDERLTMAIDSKGSVNPGGPEEKQT